MDKVFYNERTINQYIKWKLCQNDSNLMSSFLSNNINEYRDTIKSTKDSNDGVRDMVRALIIDTYRNNLYDTLNNITKEMNNLGDVVIVGNESLNNYVERNNRSITSNIHVKYIPRFNIDGIECINPQHDKYFGYLQASKSLLWYNMGVASNNLHHIIRQTFDKVSITRIGKFLGIRLNNLNISILRKYTNKKHDTFSICIKLKYWHPRFKSIGDDTLNIMDISFYNHYPHEAVYTRKRGITYMNRINNKIIYGKYLLNSNKRFFIESSYGDRNFKLLMLIFSKHVLNYTLDASLSDEDVYVKLCNWCPVVKRNHVTPCISQSMFNKILSIDHSIYTRYTFINTNKEIWKDKIIGYDTERDAWIPATLLNVIIKIPCIYI